MQNKIRNKYTNKALKADGEHFNNYKGEQGYSEVKKPLNIITVLKYIVIIVVIVISAFHLFTMQA